MTRQPISRAAAALMRALAPSPGAFIKRWRSQTWHALSFAGERVEIEFECRNQAEIDRAEAIMRQAVDMEIDLPGAILADLAAKLIGPSFLLEALLVAE